MTASGTEGWAYMVTTTRTAARAVLALVLVALLGGCGMVEQMTWVKHPEDPVLVPIAEKVKIGFGLPSTVSRGRLQAGALEHQEQIYSVVQPQIEAATGRQVEMTAVLAVFPDGAAQLNFRTVDEPVVGFWAVVALEPDGSVRPSARIEKIEGFDMATVEALYRIAYRERFAQMREYLLTTYPRFTVLPDGYLRAKGRSDPMFGNGFDSGPWDQALADRAAEEAIYQAYREDPDRTDAEWREIFERVAGDRLVGFGAALMLADPADEITEEDARQIVLDIRDNPLFPGTAEWSIGLYSNLVVRDRDYFHEEWGIVIGKDDATEADWHVEHSIDGASA